MLLDNRMHVQSGCPRGWLKETFEAAALLLDRALGKTRLWSTQQAPRGCRRPHAEWGSLWHTNAARFQGSHAMCRRPDGSGPV